MADKKGWIGVDLDGTLAMYDQWRGIDHIGEPVPAMVARVQGWLAAGVPVKIMTARCSVCEPGVVRTIEDWCEQHIGCRLPVTCQKDFGMLELWDDRAVGVVKNTGARADGLE